MFFTKNPRAINYTEWITFAKYLYKQLRWVLVEKPEARNKYVSGEINSELNRAIEQSNLLFEDYTSDGYIVNNVILALRGVKEESLLFIK